MVENFFIESEREITQNDFKNLVIFYAPILGHSSIFLYQFLYNLKNIYTKNKLFNFSEIKDILLLNEQEFEECRSKLEALSLLKSYLNKDGVYIFSLNAPLNANEISNNKIISNMLIKLITKSRYEELLKLNANYQFDKTTINDVSKKFYEVFNLENIIDLNAKNEELNFNSITLDELKDKIEPEQFISQYTKTNLSFSQNEMIRKLKRMKFNNFSINAFIYYSIKINHSVVCKYIEKIAEDFSHRNLYDAERIDQELENVYLIKQNANKELKNIKKNEDESVTREDLNCFLDLANEHDWTN